MDEKPLPYITNDAVVLGILFAVLAFVFLSNTSKRSFWVKFLHPCVTQYIQYYFRRTITTIPGCFPLFFTREFNTANA
jgi:hypothetical protein